MSYGGYAQYGTAQTSSSSAAAAAAAVSSSSTTSSPSTSMMHMTSPVLAATQPYTMAGGRAGARMSSFQPGASVAGPAAAAAGVASPPTQPAAPPPSSAVALNGTHPAGTLPPGTTVRVGEYQVRVERFLSEGGFAHVYLATSATPIPQGSRTATTKHVLKRIAVPDTNGVKEVGREVEVMKLLRNHPKIVNLIEASVSELPGGVNGSKGYEIFILMEWCAGGGIIDMMNQRLQNRLTESEILKVFSDTVEAVAHMHYQSPPLIHRDLKVENILLTPPQTFKLCDFGSTTTPVRRERVPTAVEALQKMELEINKTTTLQYRAPELVDVWSRKGYDEKVDIWALGVLLYKLCYYTTPFEEHGPLAILNAQYKIPPYPAYSDSIKGLIAGMLQESASARPNIYQVHEHVCRLRGTTIKLDNKYATAESDSVKTHTKGSSSVYDSILTSGPASSSGPSGPSLADTVSPMRRGRPAKGGPSSTASPLSSSPAPVTTAEPPRLVKTGVDVTSDKEWEMLGAKSSDTASKSGEVTSAWPTGKSAPERANGFDDSFGGVGTLPPVSATTSAGFRDAFEPSQSPKVKSTFGILVPDSPRRSSPVPYRSNASTPKKDGFVASSSGKWNGSSLSGPPVGAEDLDERARFESQFPSLDDVDLPAAFTTSASVELPSDPPRTAVASPVPTQLTGDFPPELPRRPPSAKTAGSSSTTTSEPAALRTASQSGDQDAQAPRRMPSLSSCKPGLVSRSSQTSPHLLASFNLPPTSATSASGSNASNRQPPSRSGLRQGSVPDMSLEPAGEAPASSGRKKEPSLDLLGDDEEVDRRSPLPNVLQFDGGKVGSGETTLPLVQSTLPPLTDPVVTSDSSTTGGPGVSSASRSKFRPVRPTFGSGKSSAPSARNGSVRDDAAGPPGLAEAAQNGRNARRNDDSSDDEEVEDFAPRKVAAGSASQRPERAEVEQPATTLPPITRVDSSASEGGDIDLGPALASIKKFAPAPQSTPASPSIAPVLSGATTARSPPPLLSPKPQSLQNREGLQGLVTDFDRASVSSPASPASPKPKPSPRTKPTAVGDSLQFGPGSGSKPRPQFGRTKNSTKTAAAREQAPSSSLTSGPSLPSSAAAAAATATASTRPPPFKPVPSGTGFGGSTSNSASSSPVTKTTSKALPRVPATSSPALGPSNGGSGNGNGTGGGRHDRDEDEPFKGVGNMKARWEAMSVKSSGPGAAPSGPRQAAKPAAAAAARNERAAV